MFKTNQVAQIENIIWKKKCIYSMDICFISGYLFVGCT